MMIAARVPELERLSVFIGRWLTEGETAPQDGTPAEPIVASDVYQWAPGGHFIMHPAYGRIGTVGVGGLEVIGMTRPPGSLRHTFLTARGMRNARPCPASMASGPGRAVTRAAAGCLATTVVRWPRITSEATMARIGRLQ